MLDPEDDIYFLWMVHQLLILVLKNLTERFPLVGEAQWPVYLLAVYDRTSLIEDRKVGGS